MKSEIQSLNDLVHYQEGTIVSKAIINKPNGSVTFFAFDNGQELSEHTAPFDALLQVIDGKAEHSTDGEREIQFPDEKKHILSSILLVHRNKEQDW